MSETKPTAALFVDVQNIYYTCRQKYQRQFNYRLLWQKLSETYELTIANAYAIDSNNDGQHKFQTALRSMGFNVKLKPYIQRSDGSAKGDWDVGITIDVMEAAAQVENIILMSGDGDFDMLLEHVAEKYHVRTHVMGVQELTARSLINSCNDFQIIDEEYLL
ncbi:NYN domain-containing protein [Paraneptunicella aestuarii]|uniref:LabA-like NYN domain-containing protein n=1 Tax=Paraneptunicella aestuarii TaxID=2831148 RepID=UPI001E436F40|nr:NYN domain-containing protein [Paraneptunicella aestuarii]UAA37257.1 NYN domain-containing protein [Paraneptunicella aestuarii]